MSFRLKVTTTARDDITRNASWWAEHHSLEEALQWHDTVYEQLHEILTAPESYSLSAENDDFEYELRDKPVGLGCRKTYRAIFTIVDSEVRVLAVRRGAQGRFTRHEV